MKAAIITACALMGAIIVTAHAEDPQISQRRAAERKVFTDAEIAEGFFKTAFGAEFLLAGASDRIRKYENPVRIFVESRARPDRSAEVANVVADIRAHIDHLDIAMSATRADANEVVTLVRDRELAGVIRQQYGSNRARQIQRSLAPQC